MRAGDIIWMDRLSPTAQRELLEYTADVITVLDESGTIQYESPSLERMFGYRPAELIGDNVFEYIHPDDRERVLETLREGSENTNSVTENIELRFQHEAGHWIWIESRAITEKGSEIGGYVVASRDISKRKEYERKVKRERDRLEQFASMVAHDLRNPLNVAEGRLLLAQEECESDHLNCVKRSHERMNELIENLLTLAREGGAHTQMGAVTLRETVESCWRHIDTESATLVVETDSKIVADENRLQQLLENLFRNSIEHGGDSVAVSVGDLDNGFYVEDDGDGLRKEDRDSLREYGVSTTPDGTGLGLGIVNEIAEDHGWSLTLTDGEDGGARVEITGVEFSSE
jgi:PAS domain S-box-containing protein